MVSGGEVPQRPRRERSSVAVTSTVTPRYIRAVAPAPVRAGIVGDGARERERERDNKGRTSGAVCECEWARQLTLPKCSLCADLPCAMSATETSASLRFRVVPYRVSARLLMVEPHGKADTWPRRKGSWSARRAAELPNGPIHRK